MDTNAIEKYNVPVEAVGLAELEPVPVAAPEEAAAPITKEPVWDEGKRLAMQLCWQSEYFWVASAVPSPWSQLAAHSVVSTAWEELGCAMPKQDAWQVLQLCKSARCNMIAIRPYTSPASQAWTQLIEGETSGVAVVAGALVTEDWAKVPTAKASRAVVYFILDIGSRDTLKDV